MLTNLLAIAAMCLPAQAGVLKLSNARFTFGELGPERPAKTVQAGDVVFLTFDIGGIKVETDGGVKYSIAMEVSDKDGKSIFQQKPVDRADYLPLGGNVLPARAFVSLGVDQTPGTYTCLVTVTDAASKAVGTLKQSFEVTPPAFGLVQIYMAADEKGEVPSPYVGQVGQSIWLHFSVFGFTRDEAKKQPDIAIEMTVLDKDGKTTIGKPLNYGVSQGVDASFKLVPLRILVPLNRQGEFSIRLKATDNLTKKSMTQNLKLVVLTPP